MFCIRILQSAVFKNIVKFTMSQLVTVFIDDNNILEECGTLDSNKT